MATCVTLTEMEASYRRQLRQILQLSLLTIVPKCPDPSAVVIDCTFLKPIEPPELYDLSETLGRGSTRSYHIGNTRTAKKIVGEKLCCVENSERSEKRTFQMGSQHNFPFSI